MSDTVLPLDLEEAIGRSGSLSGVDHAVVGRAGGVGRGSVVEVYLSARQAVIERAEFLAFGAPEAFACAAAACEALQGMTLASARDLDGLELARRAGIGSQALGEALVVEDAVKAALGALES